ncbi:uncharacterized protein LOC142628825 [Castanea sativa]|uniref:uncharacterized protein LOC142628825 n=1 Tax=Castanea sativa TaxID=21020 RepID=UPI003F64B0C6
MYPIKYIFEKPTLTRKISHWQMFLSKFDIMFMVQKAINGQALADYLEDQPLNDIDFSESLFPDEDVLALETELSNIEPWCWKLYFDEALNSIGNEVRVVLVSLKGQQIPISIKLNFYCMNNITEYKACIVGLLVTLEFNTNHLSIFRDSLLIISQIKGKLEARDTKLILYQKYVSHLIPNF